MDVVIKSALVAAIVFFSSLASASNGACISRTTAVDIATTNILKDHYFSRNDEALLEYAGSLELIGGRYLYSWPLSVYTEAYIEVTCLGVFTFDHFDVSD